MHGKLFALQHMALLETQVFEYQRVLAYTVLVNAMFEFIP